MSPHEPTILDLLRTRALAAAAPEIAWSPPEGLSARIRWAHVVEGATGVAELLSGRELLLSTGVGWPSDPLELSSYLDDLLGAGPCALLLELGGRYACVPEQLVRACRSHGVVLVVVRRRVSFMTITEDVHRHIVDGQTSALVAKQRVHDLFVRIHRAEASMEHVLEVAGRELATTVVLEDLQHHVVDAHGPQALEASLLENWETRSRNATDTRRSTPGSPSADPQGWLIAPVTVRHSSWGRLVALPGPDGAAADHPAGAATVLEAAALALCIERLSSSDPGAWRRHAHESALRRLTGHDWVTASDMVHVLESRGFPVRRRLLVAATIGATAEVHRNPEAFQGPLQHEGAALGLSVMARPVSLGSNHALAACLSLPEDDVDASRVHRLAERLHALWPGGVHGLVVGSATTDLSVLIESLQETQNTLRVAKHPAGPAPLPLIVTTLSRFVTRFADSPAFALFGEEILRPLLVHDARHGTDLLGAVRHLVQHPGNRSRAAAASGLSRSSFYQRIAQAERLLGRDLTTGDALTSLALAIAILDESR